MKYLALFALSVGSLYPAEFVTGQAARAVIGQQTFTNQLPGTTQYLLGGVGGVAYANGTLIVVDSNRVQADPINHRVIIYRDIASQLPGPTASFDFNPEERCPVCVGNADVVIGQTDFDKSDIALTRTGLRNPTSVATDGRYLAIADTDNNRILIYNSIPTSNTAPADVVVGQPDFTTAAFNFGGSGNTPSAKGLRGPQGVWIQNGKLYVADTLNHRVLIWNSIPTTNGKEADIVLGKPNFTTGVQPDLTQAQIEATASTLLDPVSVTSDGTRLYVADLGHNRVVIWNSIPTSNAQPADIVLGQPSLVSTQERNATRANNSTELCAPTGEKDAQGNTLYPTRCAATMDFPRFALSDGKRLFVADGGNDRILVYNTIPTTSGQLADVILGQQDDKTSTQGNEGLRVSSADTIYSPLSLAWDGVNLYATDPFNRRVLVYTPADVKLPTTSIRNAASQDIFAVGTVEFSADPLENEEVTVKIVDKEYKYKAAKDHKISNVVNSLAELINADAGDPNVIATPIANAGQLLLTARKAGPEGNIVAFNVTVPPTGQIDGTASGATLRGGQDAAQIAPGSLIIILGENLSDQTAAAPLTNGLLPTKLGGTQVYIDGIPAPLLYVSPGQINAQLPWEVNDAYGVSAFVRTEGANGQVRFTSSVAVPVIPNNPGIFAEPGTDPRRAVAFHGSSFATGVVSVDGTIKENDTAAILIEEREYTYTVKSGDTLANIRDGLIELINAAEDEKVRASAAGVFTRIILTSKTPGEEGEGLEYTVKTSTNASVILTPLTDNLCCANVKGAPITEANPAVPGETIIIYGAGLGFVLPDEAKFSVVTGGAYTGPEVNFTNTRIDALVGGRTANVLFGGLRKDAVGVYEIHLQLNPSLPTNPQTQMTIAQDINVSNIATIPVRAPEVEE